MEKAFWQRAAVTLVMASSLSGCASGGGAQSWSSRLAFWRQNEPVGLASSVHPDFSKNYANQVSPERGDIPEPTGEMPKPPESSWAKFTSAVSGSSSKAVKSVKSVFQRDGDDELADAGAKSSEWKDLDKPTGPNVYIMLAETMERSGNFDRAAAQYELALKVDKDSLPVLLGYARLLDRQGKFAEASELYERASRAHPQEASVYNDLALCLSRQGRKEEAAAKMQQAVKLQPDRKLYRNNMAKLLVDINEPDAALEQLAAAHPLGVAHYNLGYLLAQKGDQQRAAHHFARALEHDASLDDARRWLETLNGAAPPAQSTGPAYYGPMPGGPAGNSAVPGPYGPPAAAYGPPAPPPAYGGPAPSASYGPGAAADSQPSGSPAGAGPQWAEPQLSPPQGAQHRPGSAALPTVLRPNSLPPGPRYGMAPTGFEPPSQY